jgi:hypothetical protein
MGLSKGTSASAFNSRGGGSLCGTDFCAFLIQKFNRETAQRVLEIFEKMDVPAPQKQDEFLVGTEGCLVFLNKYAIVLRIEIADLEDSKWGADRINDSGWIIQPIASLNAGKAIIEICPGCHLGENLSHRTYLADHLQNQNINFWDSGISNVGKLPFKTPFFPDGVPVVIDRLAVIRLSRNAVPILEALKSQAEVAKKAQEELYGPLREAFAAAWPEAGKMRKFWSLCLRYVREGKLVGGWKKAEREGSMKSFEAAQAAKHYEARWR